MPSDQSINELLNKALGDLSLAINYLSLGLTIPKNTVLFAAGLKYDILTTAPTAFSLTIYKEGLYFQFNPPLKLDVMALLPNAYIDSGSFSFKTGELEKLEILTDASALINLPPAQRMVKKQVENKLRFYFSVLLNNNVWPQTLLTAGDYDPFKDPNLLHRILTLQMLVNSRTKSLLGGGFDLHSLQYVRILALLKFDALYHHPVSPGALHIPQNTDLHIFIYLQNTMADLVQAPQKTKISTIHLVSNNIQFLYKNKVLVLFKNLKINYGGEVIAYDVEIQNKTYQFLKMSSLLLKMGLLLGVLKTVAGAPIPSGMNPDFIGESVLINGFETALIEQALQKALLQFVNTQIPSIQDKGIDLKKALGIIDHA